MNRHSISLFPIAIIGVFASFTPVDATPSKMNVQQYILPSNTFDPPALATPPPAIPPPVFRPVTPPSAASTPAPNTPLALAVPPPDAVLKFSGQGPFNSRPFNIADHWEVDWDSPGPLNITLGHLDGKPDEVIGQQAGPSHGSSFQPSGGQYYLKIVGTGNWVVWMVQVGTGTSAPVTPVPQPVAPSTATTPGAPTPPANGLPTAPTNYGDPSYYQNPIVIVRGDNAVGTGFLMKMGQSTYVITNQHVISNNPNLNLQTIKGQNLVATALQAATDRDLAMFTIKDDGTLPSIPFATDVAGVTQKDDDTVIPGNSQGGGVIVDTPGKIVGVGPVRVEVSNPIYPGNSGSPVVDLRIKKAVAVITEVEKSDNDGFVNQSSLANHNSAIQAVRYFSLRFDNVPKWEPIDLPAFYRQTHFIDGFHENSLELISFFKALQAKHEQEVAQQQQQQQQQYSQYQYQQQQQQPQQPQQPQSEDNGVSLTLYRNNAKLSDIMDRLNNSQRESSSDADITAKAQECALELGSVAETDIATMQNPSLFYSFNKTRSSDEMDLRNKIIEACKDISQQLTKQSN